MNINEDKFSSFEKGLRKKIEDSNINYRIIESVLFSRISEAEALKELSILKLDKIPPPDTMERVEHNLFSQIIQYSEYEIPTNECINNEYDLSVSQWDRLFSKIEERINDHASLPKWEQVLRTPEKEPLEGEWEQIEDTLFSRINSIAQRDPWEQCTKLDEINIEGSLESVEKRLDKQIQNEKGFESWEYVLKCEEVLPYSKWEEFEEKLFEKIENDNGELKLDKQPFWSFVDYYLIITKVARFASVGLILALLAVGGYYSQYIFNPKVPTMVYQIQGKAVNSVRDIKNGINQVCSSVPGGAISLINSHGFVELQNGSKIEIEKLSKLHALYKVAFAQTNADNEIARGRVSFLVNPHHGKETFKVETPDYQIIVKGTYFKVEPDLGGKVSTRVLEGEIKIVSKYFPDTVVKAGQSLVYDIFTKSYKIQNGGAIVQRKEIETVPDVEELQNYKVISIKTSVSDADIRIDGRYYGTAPLTIRESAGPHHIWIGKNGYVSVDSLIQISDRDSIYSLNISLNEISIPKEPIEIKPEKVQKNKSKYISPEMVAEKLLGKMPAEREEPKYSEEDSLFNMAQKEESNGSWKEAILLYQKVFDNPEASRLRKEDALFSIGKIKADHQGVDAKQIFLTYLAMYPGGAFAGETWLRLAELEFKTNPENAVQYYLKYFDMFPRHPRIAELQNRVGVIYLQERKYDEAISMFRQAMSNLVSPGKGERQNISANLRRALEAKGDTKSADSIWRQYIATSEDKE